MKLRLDGQIVESCSQKKDLNALEPVLVCILGIDRVIPFFDLSERDGRDVQTRSADKQIVFLEESYRSANRS